MTLTPTLEDLATFVDPDSPVLTPHGAQVVYMDTSTPADGPRVSELWIRPVPPTTGTARQLTSARATVPPRSPLTVGPSPSSVTTRRGRTWSPSRSAAARPGS